MPARAAVGGGCRPLQQDDPNAFLPSHLWRVREREREEQQTLAPRHTRPPSCRNGILGGRGWDRVLEMICLARHADVIGCGGPAILVGECHSVDAWPVTAGTRSAEADVVGGGKGGEPMTDDGWEQRSCQRHREGAR